MAVQFRNLWKKIILLLLWLFILRLAGQISCLGGCSKVGGSVRAHSLFLDGFPVHLVLLREPGDTHRSCHSTAQLPPHTHTTAPRSSRCSATALEVPNSPGVAECSPFGATRDALVRASERRCSLQTPSNKTNLMK